MKRLRRAAFVMVVLLVLAAGAIIVGARAKRSASGPVESMGSGLHHVRNLVTDLYGARVGTEVVLFDAGLDPQGRAIDDLLRTLGAKRRGGRIRCLKRQDATDAKTLEEPEELDEHVTELFAAALEVHRVLGPGLLESVYEHALLRGARIEKCLVSACLLVS